MPAFEGELFGSAVYVTTIKADEEAAAIANDTLEALGTVVQSRDTNRVYRFARAIEASRV